MFNSSLNNLDIFYTAGQCPEGIEVNVDFDSKDAWEIESDIELSFEDPNDVLLGSHTFMHGSQDLAITINSADDGAPTFTVLALELVVDFATSVRVFLQHPDGSELEEMVGRIYLLLEKFALTNHAMNVLKDNVVLIIAHSTIPRHTIR